MDASKLKQLHTLGLVLACGALAAGCAGNSVKPMEQQPAPEIQTGMVDKAVIETKTTEPVQQVEPETEKTVASIDSNQQPEIQVSEVQPQTDMQPVDDTTQPEKLSFYFGFDKSDLDEQDIDVIKQHAHFLKDNPMLVLEINGHTDSNGPHAYNEYLSKKRAEAVASVLIEAGVPRSQLVINALADDKPLADNASPGKNRRVDLQYDEANMLSTR